MKNFFDFLNESAGVKLVKQNMHEPMVDKHSAELHHERAQYHADMVAHHSQKAADHLSKGNRRGFFDHNVAANRHSDASLTHLAASESFTDRVSDKEREFQSTDVHEAGKQSRVAHKATLKARKHP